MVRNGKSVLFFACAICLWMSQATGAVNLESCSDPLHKKSVDDTVADALANVFRLQDRETYPLTEKAGIDDWFFVEIRSKCNMNIFSPKDKGTRCPVFIEQMPFGRQSYYGVPFDIVDPEKNKNESVIALASKRLRTNDYPDTITLPVKHKANALYLLMTAYYANSEGDQSFTLTYRDGSTQRIKLRGSADLLFTQGEKNAEIEGVLNIGDWYKAKNIVHNFNSRYVLIPESKGSKSSFHALHVIQWINPDPSKEISSITFRSDRNAPMAPFIIAITGVCGIEGMDKLKDN